MDGTIVRADKHAAGARTGAEPTYKNARVKPADHALGHSRGGWSTKSHVAVDPSGHLRSVVVTPDQAGENPRLIDVLETTGTKGVPGGRAHGVLPSLDPGLYAPPPDRGHHPRTRRPDRPPQSQGQRRRQAPAFDQAIYKGRNVVERFSNRIKEFRGIPTRYDKHARNYRVGIVVAGIILHLRDQLCDTP